MRSRASAARPSRRRCCRTCCRSVGADTIQGFVALLEDARQRQVPHKIALAEARATASAGDAVPPAGASPLLSSLLVPTARALARCSRRRSHHALHAAHALHAPPAHDPNTNAIIGIAYDAFDPDVICEEFNRMKSMAAEANGDDEEPKEDPKKKPDTLARGKHCPKTAWHG